MDRHYVEIYAPAAPGTVLVGSGGAVELVNPTAVVEVVEAATTPSVVEVITAGGQGPPGPPGPTGDPAHATFISLVPYFLLASN